MFGRLVGTQKKSILVSKKETISLHFLTIVGIWFEFLFCFYVGILIFELDNRADSEQEKALKFLFFLFLFIP